MLIKSKIEMLFAEWFMAQKETNKQQATSNKQ
jgi:hypothetical protein